MRLSYLCVVLLVAIHCEASPVIRSQQRPDAGDKPQLVVQLGDPTMTTDVWLSTGNRFALTESEGAVILWEVSGGRRIRTFQGRNANFSADGNSILMEKSNGRSYLLDIGSARETQQFDGTHPIFAPEGPFVLTLQKDIAVMWDKLSGKEVKRFAGQTGNLQLARFSANGKYLMTFNENYVATLWDIDSQREITWVRERLNPFYNGVPALSPDGRFIVACLNKRGIPEVALWSSIAGEKLHVLSKEPRYGFSAQFSPDGQYVFVEMLNNKAGLFRVDTGEKVKEFHNDLRDEQGNIIIDPGIGVKRISFSTDGSRIVVLLSSLSGVTDNPSSRVLIYDLKEDRPRLIDSDVEQFSLSKDGVYVITATEYTDVEGGDIVSPSARLLETNTGNEVRRFEGQAGGVFSVVFSKDGRYVVTGGKVGTVLWDLSRGGELRRFNDENTNCVDISPDARRIIASHENDNALLWDTDTGDIIAELGYRYDGCLVSPLGRQYLLCSLWDMRPIDRVSEKASGSDDSFKIDEYLTKHLVAAFSDGARILVQTYEEDKNKTVVFDLNRKKMVFTLDDSVPLALSDDNLTILTQYKQQEGRLIDAKTGKLIKKFPAQETIYAADFSRDGNYIAYASDETAYILNRHTFEVKHRLEGHNGLINKIRFSPNSRWVLTGSLDGTSRLWNAQGGYEVCDLISFADGNWVVVSPDGRFDTNNLEAIDGLHWVMPDDPLKPLPLETFMRDYYEPHLLTKLLDDIPDHEQFKAIRNLTDLNRTQPKVNIKNIIRQQNAPELATVIVEVSGERSERQKDKDGKLFEIDVYDLRLFRDGQIVGQCPEQQTVTRPTAAPSLINDKAVLQDWRERARIDLKQEEAKEVVFENIHLPRSGLKSVVFTAYAFNGDRVKSKTDMATAIFNTQTNAKIMVKSKTEGKVFYLGDALPVRKGRAFVVAIGIKSFENSQWDLKFTAKDAKMTEKVLTKRLARGNAYSEVVSITLVSDSKEGENHATREQIKGVIDLLAGREVSKSVKAKIPNAEKVEGPLQPEDLLIIYFSTHGYADRAGNFYLFPSDIGKQKAPVINAGIKGVKWIVTEEIKDKAVSSEMLSMWLRGVDARDIIMIVDACNSSGVVQGENGEELKPGPMGSRGMGQMAYDKGMKILAASQTLVVAGESRRLKQSLLTYAMVQEGILRGLADADKNGLLTLNESLRYVEERVPPLIKELIKRGEDELKVVKDQRPALFDFTKNREEIVLTRRASGTATTRRPGRTKTKSRY